MSEQMGNLGDYFLIPDYLRQTYLELTDWFDKEWEPYFSKMMPRTQGPGRGSKRTWTRDWAADPQGIAKFYGDDDEIEPMNYPQIQPWNFWTRKMGNAFRRNKRVFAGDFKEGIIEKAHAEMLENLTKWINRGIEFTLSRFAYGDVNTMARFTTQNTNRQAVVNLPAGTFNGVANAGLGGTSWSNFAAGTPTVFEDLAFIKKQYKRMADQNAVFMMVGRETEYNLELNDDLLDRLIRIENTTQGILGDALMGLMLLKVTGQTYKDVIGANAMQIGMPGRGDYSAQDWTNLNKNDMMTEQIGGNTFEWSIVSSGDVGEVKCGWVDEDHEQERGSASEIFIEQFSENRPKQVWTRASLHMCPEVKDYARLMLIRGVAQQVD